MILVAGGGPAGAAAAALLAKAGREVVLVEREAAPAHKVCGEFLSSEAQAYLAASGLDIAVLGGHRITHVRLARGKRCITGKLPFEGLGITRKTLDEALLAHAMKAGAEVRRGHAIRNIGPGMIVEIDQTEPLKPSVLLLATGKHEARGAARPANPGGWIGFKTYFRLGAGQRAELAGHVELIVFPGGYAGLELVETGEANFSCIIEKALFARVGGKWENLLDHLKSGNPHLVRRLEGAAEMLGAPLSVARIPYGFMHHPSPDELPRLYRLGDQAAVIHSFTGDGMAIALHSAALAARSVLAGNTAAYYHRCLARSVAGQIRRAGALHGAISSPVLGPAFVAAAGVFPKILGIAAALTRVPGDLVIE